jgi:outer membrane protein assembly factor BamA
MGAALLLSLMLLQVQASASQVPPAGSSDTSGEIIAEVRVHGNYATADADVLRLAGVTLGEPLHADSVQRITRRLRDSGRFQQVEVRKRYRSLTDTQQVVLILLVQEQPSAGEPPGNPLLKPFRRLPAHMQFLPIIDFADGYGFTYGLLTSFADTLGKQSRIAVPLTWGASRRAAVEVDKTFNSGPVSRVEGGAAISVRENPFFREDDGRRQVWGRAERVLLPQLKLGGQLGVTHVKFEPFHDTFATYGADLTLDTRRDRIFPRDAIFASAGWDALNFTGGAATVNRTHADVRGYVGLIGQSVLSVRARIDNADGPVPPYEQWLLGGSSSLRGFRTGAFVGDNRALAGAEVRVPLSSPLGISRAGISLFADSGAVYDHGVHLRDATFHQGAGAGVFWLAPFLQLNLDVAYGFGNRLRVHFTSGFTF